MRCTNILMDEVTGMNSRVRRLILLVIAAALFGGSLAAFAEGATLTVVHELGTTEVPRNPQRPVVFDLGALETLHELGVDVVGVPRAAFPAHLEQYNDDRYAKVGTLVEPDFEAIHRTNPDLIIISGRQAQHYEELSGIAPTIYVGIDTADYFPSFKNNVRLLASLFDKADPAEAKLTELEAAIEAMRSRTAGKTALVLVVTGGRASAFGSGSRYGLVYDVFGLTPVDDKITATGSHGQRIAWE